MLICADGRWIMLLLYWMRRRIRRGTDEMFLTRIGFGSKVVITGDLSQKDLPFSTQSGLEQALKVLKDVDEIGVSYLTNKDVVRHPLVQKIVHAYEKFEAREQYREKRKNERKRK